MFKFLKKYKYIFLILPLIFLYRYDLFLFPEKATESVGEIFLTHMFGGSYHLEKANLHLSVVGLVGIIYMSLLFSDYITADLLECADYIFVRYDRRRKWIVRKLYGLSLYCALGIFLYVLLYIQNALTESCRHITKKDIQVILCTYVMLLVFSYCMIILINGLALRLGTTIGFIISYSLLILSSMLTIAIQNLGNIRIANVLHKINPMSNILVSWNFTDFHVLWGLGYFVVLAICLSSLLWYEVKHYEIGLGYIKLRKVK